jgi:preprotein translocase subunit SecD
VYNPPKTNIKQGLDLQGGVRVLLKPEEKVSKTYTDDLISSLNQRLNVYGLSDVVIRSSNDLSGNQYILIELAGANEEEVKELIAKQGKFEAKVGNNTVFRGGEDITYVCRSADCSGIDPGRGCGVAAGGGYVCRFRFSISLSPEAAERQASLTRDLEVIVENNDEYLSEKLYLYLDDKEVDQLNIGADLKGRAVTDIQISGTGGGATNQEAVYNALQNMKKLQTMLITGSLPVKLNIVKTDNVSPVLGEEFVNNALFMGLLILISVAVMVSLRYRKIQITVPMTVSLISEVVLLIGVASIIGWNIDLPAIAGIIIAIGTGVDHQIVIADETIGGRSVQIFDWKKRIKKAFFIITAAYLTTVVAMMPLIFAGAGLLKGFALTTIIGVSIGIFITRPAFANVVEILLRE